MSSSPAIRHSPTASSRLPQPPPESPPRLYPPPLENQESQGDCIHLPAGKSGTLQVKYSGPVCEVVLRRGRTAILDGCWDQCFVAAGRAVGSEGTWTNSCLERDDDSSYLELCQDLAGGGRIERQIYVAPQDGFAFLADAVTGPAGEWERYDLQLPLAAGIACHPAGETQECELLAGSRWLARVLPVSLPEWRCGPVVQLKAAGGRLGFSLPRAGDRLHAALFLDLEPKRKSRAVTWRQLTVGEALQVVPGDTAVGYRVQVGKSQWLFYRSLAPAGNRSVLGQNFRGEFVVARFRTDGTVERLLEIE